MQKSALLLLLLSSLLAVGWSAPTNQQVSMEELLAEVSSRNLAEAQDNNMAEIEKINDLLSSGLGIVRNLVQNRLNREGGGGKYGGQLLGLVTNFLQNRLNSPNVIAEAQDDNMAEVENINDLLSSGLDIVRNLVQDKLSREGKDGGQLLDLVTNLLQNRLNSPNVMAQVLAKVRTEAVEESDEDADIQRNRLTSLVADLSKILSNGLQNTLQKRGKKTAARVVDRVNDFLQGVFRPELEQPTEADEVDEVDEVEEESENNMADEQNRFQDLLTGFSGRLNMLSNRVNNYVQRRLQPTPTPTQTPNAIEQALQDLVAGVYD